MKSTIYSLIFFLFSGSIMAGESIYKKWKVQTHGFISQSYIKTNANNFFGKSNSNSAGNFSFTEAAFNISARPFPKLLVSAQGVFRRAGQGHDPDTGLDYALVDYTLFANADWTIGLRAGKLKHSYGMYNSSRDAVATRPSIILPQSIYPDIVRKFALSSYGGQLYLEKRMANGFLSFDAQSIDPSVSATDNELIIFGGFDAPGRFEGRPSYTSRLAYEWYNGTKIAITRSRVNHKYVRGDGDPSASARIDWTGTVFSFEHNSENWVFTAEYLARKFKPKGSPKVLYFPTLAVGSGYYVQGQYQIKRNWWGLARYDVTYLNEEDKNGKKIEAATGGAFPAHKMFAKDFTLGLRWNINPQWLVSAEHHWINGTAWLTSQDNRDLSQTEQKWNMAMALVSYRF